MCDPNAIYKKRFALAMLPPELAGEGSEVEIDILGKRYSATVVEETPYDPENKALRA